MIRSQLPNFLHQLFNRGISPTYIEKAVFYETSQLDNFLSSFV